MTAITRHRKDYLYLNFRTDHLPLNTVHRIMETIHPTVIEPPCEDCKKLLGADRRIVPHQNLKLTGSKPMTSMFGSVGEYYYECKKCGKSWLHETGSYGEGWIE
jgi:hypothetical protein